MDLKEWLLLGVLSVLWGGAFFFVGIIVKELPPFTVVLGRISLAAMVLVCYLSISGGRLPTSPRLWGALMLMGALNALLPYSLITWGQGHIDSGLASIFISTTPLFSVVLTHVRTSEERLTPTRLLGVLLGLGGVVILIGPEALRGVGRHALGQLAVLAAALSYACAGIYGRRFKELSPVVTSAGQVASTVVLVLPLALVWERPWTLHPSAVTWAALLGLGLLSTALAYLIFFRILAAAGATNVMLVNFLIPVSALLLGMLLLGERPGWSVFGGMACIFTGLITIDGRLLSRPPARAPYTAKPLHAASPEP